MMIPVNADAAGLIFACWLDGRGGAIDITDAGPAGRAPPDVGILWLHFEQRHQGTERWLHQESGLDAVVADAMLGVNPRPRTLIRDNAALISLRGISVDPEAPGATLAFQLWSDGQSIITCRDHQVVGVSDIRRELRQGQGPRTSGELIVALSDRLVDRMDDVIGDAEAQTQRLGHAGAQSDTGELVGELAALRRRMMRLRRYLAPQRRALSVLAATPVDWLDEGDRDRLRAVAEQTAEYAEGLDSALAITAVTQDELLQRSSEKTEQRMYALTLLTGVFMPLTFVTGLLGVNLAGIPGAESPIAFLVLCALLVIVVLTQLLILHVKRWL